MKPIYKKQASMILLIIAITIVFSYGAYPIGTWYDCDYNEYACSSDLLCGEDWGAAGESGVGEYSDLTTEMCCGDDDSEFFSICGTGDISWSSSCGNVGLCCSVDSCIDPFTSTCESVGQKEFSGQTDDKYAYCSDITIWLDCDETLGCSIPNGADVYAGEIVGEYEDLTTIESCGDDDGEYYRHNENGDGFGGDGCCDSNTDCVYYNSSWDDSNGHPMTCFSAGSYLEDKYCNSGEWEDQDYSHYAGQGNYLVPYCNFDASYETTNYFNCDVNCDTYDNNPANGFCCGDDPDEYYKDDSSTGGGRACCDDDSYCANSAGQCGVGTENYLENNRYGVNTCTDGLDNDCDGSIDSAQELSDCPSCGNGDCSIMIVSNNEIEENAFNCPADCMGEFVGWKFSDDSKAQLSDTETRNGSYSLNLFGTGIVIAAQNITDLTPGDFYVVFAHAKKIFGSPSIILGVTDAEGTVIDTTSTSLGTEWTRLELIVAVPSNGKLQVRLLKTSGSVVFDDIAVIYRDHAVDDQIPYVDSNYSYGCCGSNQCWTGFGCQELTDEHLGFSEDPKPVCVEDGTDISWKLPYKKENWYLNENYLGEDVDKYCPKENQCWFSGRGAEITTNNNNIYFNEGEDSCLNKDEFKYDLFCDDWTSRNAILAANILELAEAYDGSETDTNDFSLVCDNSECFSFMSSSDFWVPLTPEEIKTNCEEYALSCIYKSGDTMIVGSLLRNFVPYINPNDPDSCETSIFGGPSDPIEDPDINPKCFLQEILNVKQGYYSPDFLTVNFEDQPYFYNAQFIASDFGHRIKSIGWNNLTNVLIISNKNLEYENNLGEGINTSILWEKFTRLKQFKDGTVDPSEWPDNIFDPLLSEVNNTEDFKNIILVKKGNISFEAINEMKFDNSLIEYTALLYGNKTNSMICDDLSNIYVDEYNEIYRDNFFNCSENLNGYVDSFIQCGAEGIVNCEEYELFGHQPDLSNDRKFKRKVWHNLTFRLRDFKNCALNNSYEISEIPDYYKDIMTIEEDFIYGNRQTDGCCLADQCWNGFECVESYSLFDYDGGDPTYMCNNGDWGLSYPSYDWEDTDSGYCAYDYQCYVSKTAYENEFGDFSEANLDSMNCTTIAGAFYDDHYCLNRNWTTRTAVLAAGFLNFTTSSDIGEFTLFCDNYSSTLNIYQDIDYSNMNKVCVLKYHDLFDDEIKVAVGTSLNDDVSLFLAGMPDVSEDVCDGKGNDGFEACVSDILWWDNNLKIIVYNEDGMEFGQQGFLQELWDFLLNPIESVINWVAGFFTQTTVTAPQDFDKFYAVREDGRNISAVVVEKHQPYVLISYRGFSTDITSAMERRDELIEVSETGDGFDVTSTVFDVLYMDWTSLTARLRLTPLSLINDPPVVNMPDIQLNNQRIAIIDLDDYVNDPDNLDDEMTWTYSGNTDINVFINPGTHVAIFTAPSIDWNGTETIIFTATDPEGLFDSDDTIISSP